MLKARATRKWKAEREEDQKQERQLKILMVSSRVIYGRNNIWEKVPGREEIRHVGEIKHVECFPMGELLRHLRSQEWDHELLIFRW